MLYALTYAPAEYRSDLPPDTFPVGSAVADVVAVMVPVLAEVVHQAESLIAAAISDAHHRERPQPTLADFWTVLDQQFGTTVGDGGGPDAEILDAIDRAAGDDLGDPEALAGMVVGAIALAESMP